VVSLLNVQFLRIPFLSRFHYTFLVFWIRFFHMTKRTRYYNKIKNKILHCQPFQNPIEKIVKRGNIYIPSTWQYVTKNVSDLRQMGDFRVLNWPPLIKTMDSVENDAKYSLRKVWRYQRVTRSRQSRDNTMAKTNREKGQTVLYKTLHEKLKLEQHQLH